MSNEWIVIAWMTVMTFVSRVVPLLLIAGMTLSKRAERWLSLIAPAIIAALLLPELTLDRSGVMPVLSVPNTYLLAAIPAFITAFFTKNMLLTVVAGIVSAALIRLF
ncbi:MAG: AzlD domain-containing protein [Synergistaceae bacterium]|jgi:branched-subunit amino acid transport protein|nr:AzlD domain-containing protein [Synergistaceae bacterium]